MKEIDALSIELDRLRRRAPALVGDQHGGRFTTEFCQTELPQRTFMNARLHDLMEDARTLFLSATRRHSSERSPSSFDPYCDRLDNGVLTLLLKYVR